MGKINGCLKCLFIFFNVLFMILGFLMILGAMKATADSIQMSSFGDSSLSWIWMMSITMLGIPCLGIYAACAEKDFALKIYAGFLMVGIIILLISGIVVVVWRNEFKDWFQRDSSESVEPMMADKNWREFLGEIQTTFECCGVNRAEDWGSEISDSCECRSSQCRTKPQGSSGPNTIYSQPCEDYIFWVIDMVFKLIIGVLFGSAVTEVRNPDVLGQPKNQRSQILWIITWKFLVLLISIFMIRKVNRDDSAEGPSIAM